MFIGLAIVLTLIVIVLFVSTQVIVPLLQGTPMFALFSKNPQREAVRAAEQNLETATEKFTLDKELAEINKAADALKNKA